MNGLERKQYITRILEETGVVNIAELAAELNVSSMTIRRDLARMEQEGIVKTEYGGAVLNNSSQFEFSILQKQRLNAAEKRAIGKYCAEQIRNGETVFLDAGTTPAEIAQDLVHRKNLTVMTNSLLAANCLSKAKDIRLVMCPGVYRDHSMAFMGQLTDEFVKNFRVDRLYLAVEGIDEQGVSVPDLTDGGTKRSLISCARTVICVADSSKFGKHWTFNICPLSAIDEIVTDSGIDSASAEQIRAAGITLTILDTEPAQ